MLASVLHFYSGKPLQIHSGVDTMTALDLPHIEANRSRHGRVRYYFRMKGRRIARLPDNPSTQPFVDAYWAIRNKHEGKAVPTKPATNQQGTFGFLCQAYMNSEPFKRLDPQTQRTRQGILNSMLAEPITRNPGEVRTFAHMPMAALTVGNLEVLRDRKSKQPFAADQRIKILRQVLETKKAGGKEKHVKENTARLVSMYRKKTDGWHTIRDDELMKYIKHHGVGSKPVLALGLLMYTGMRVSDLSLIGPQHRIGDWFRFKIYKDRNRHPKEMSMPVHPALEAILAVHKHEGPAYMLTEYGKPFSIKGLSKKVSEWFDEASLSHCSAHCVRKGLATSLAEGAATDSMLDGMFGWSGGQTSKIYTKKKEQALLARQAVAKITWGELDSFLPHPATSGGPVCHTP